MKLPILGLMLTVGMGWLIAPSAFGEIVLHDESIQGDLSNGDPIFDSNFDIIGYTGDDLGALPGAMGSTPGIGSVIGQTDFQQIDLFTIEVTAGSTWDELRLTNFDSGGADNNLFIAIEDSELFPENFFIDPGEFSALRNSFFGYALVGTADLGGDVLGKIGSSNNNFGDDLGPGIYSVYIQQTGPATDYRFDFVTVPEPGSVTVLLLGGAAFWARRRRRHGV